MYKLKYHPPVFTSILAIKQTNTRKNVYFMTVFGLWTIHKKIVSTAWDSRQFS